MVAIEQPDEDTITDEEEWWAMYGEAYPDHDGAKAVTA